MDRFSRGLPAGSSVTVTLKPAGSRLKLQLSSSANNRRGQLAEADRTTRRSVGPVLSWNPSTGSLHLSRQATQQLFRRLGGRLTERSGSGLTVFFPIG
jgi:BRCT domain type II-containing protein